jgi:hypothetical protein
VGSSQETFTRIHRLAALAGDPAVLNDSEEALMSDLDTSADRPWTVEAVHQLRELAREGVAVSVISLKLKRSIVSVRAKLADLGLTAPEGA